MLCRSSAGAVPTENLIRRHRASVHLNLVRGLAALAVVAYHVRYRFFLDYQDVSDPDALANVFYFLTAFGHDAVMVFFVLSGYLIGTSVRRDVAVGRWSWARYGANRLTRLSVVLIPGLLLTVCWDAAGLRLFPDHPVYTGAERSWTHDFFSVHDRLTGGVFAANAAYLQSIIAPPLGSNEPLWSLSFEFWYYLLFPLAWLALRGGYSTRTAIAFLTLFAVVLASVGRNIAVYFPIWLVGVAVGSLPHLASLRGRALQDAKVAATILFCGSVSLTHTGFFKEYVSASIRVIDYCTALSIGALLYVLLHDDALLPEDRYARIARRLAGISFTLYVTHMPMLVWLRAALVPDAPWSSDPVHIGYGVLLTASCVAYAAVVARFTEARTERIRRAVSYWVTTRFAPRSKEESLYRPVP